ncbi:GTPase IMAP family member 7-like isoform X1 [Poecilia formosa]|uniref:GTPase IMAP family member 7-like isoform X1 n=1 Tax=Poecilia formosa TaxID=48698 RepID=UPI000443F642|nr:PREDICTED: GTPase IMAP family member 7-like isoform X1 [Poecilia formosa]
MLIVSTDKSSVVILGNGKFLKEAVITNFLEKDLSSLTKREIKSTTVYVTNELEFICTPDVKTSREEIKALFSKKQFYDMHLVVVEKGFSPQGAWDLIVDLNKTTGVEAENLFVVLPRQHKQLPEYHYPFKFYTFDQLESKLRELGKKPTASSSKPTVEGNKGRHPDTKVNLVLLGMAGTGKSASGNTIIGKKVFESKVSCNPITKECWKEEAQINGLNVRVIDTPDLFDDEIAKVAKEKHVKKCKELCESDPCVFVLVMHVSRFTDGERDVLKKLEKMFGEEVSKQTVLLFTRGNDLRQADMSFKDFLHDCQDKLKEIVAKCDNRCVLFENSNSDSDQVDKLMNMVDLVLKNKKFSQ